MAGLILSLAGAGTWPLVSTSLGDEPVTVAQDASWFAGEKVDGAFTAYAEAVVIEKLALESSGGKTYAERVVSFGIAAMPMGLGCVLVLVLVGFALRAIGYPRTVWRIRRVDRPAGQVGHSAP
ncbi:hypothetical protein BH24ACT10_BH24ACT10_17070 [soil metagenome]